jgi:hypothetical protein
MYRLESLRSAQLVNPSRAGVSLLELGNLTTVWT